MTNSALGEEIWWLRGFGWSMKQIAQRLDCSLAVVQRHLSREEPHHKASDEELFEIAAAARHEARLVYGRTVKQWI